jgi:hypothetical protein
MAGKLLRLNPENAGNVEKRTFGPAPLQRSQTWSGWGSEFNFAPPVNETGISDPGFNSCDPQVPCTKMHLHNRTKFEKIVDTISGAML